MNEIKVLLMQGKSLSEVARALKLDRRLGGYLQARQSLFEEGGGAKIVAAGVAAGVGAGIGGNFLGRSIDRRKARTSWTVDW